VRCKDCGADVPVLREFCPGCGAPTDSSLRERQRLLGQDRPPRTDSGPTGNRTGFAVAAAVLLLGVGLLASNGLPFGGADDPGEVRQRSTVTIEAEQLYTAYRDDPRGSQERFGGREMVVSGEFVRIVPDGYGSLDLRLKTSDPGVELGVDLAQLAIEDGRSLRPGQRVTVSCQQMGNGGEELWVQDCAIQPTAPADEPASEPAPASGAAASDGEEGDGAG
jgi:hypothetical protein